jgi:hypothetical protein
VYWAGSVSSEFINRKKGYESSDAGVYNIGRPEKVARRLCGKTSFEVNHVRYRRTLRLTDSVLFANLQNEFAYNTKPIHTDHSSFLRLIEISHEMNIDIVGLGSYIRGNETFV